MSYTQADLDNLDAAIARGVRTVKIADREVTYLSLAELIKARNHVAGQMTENVASTSPLKGRTLYTHQNGRGL